MRVGDDETHASNPAREARSTSPHTPHSKPRRSPDLESKLMGYRYKHSVKINRIV